MVMPLKKERNKKIVELRDQDPKKWTWSKLGSYFHIARNWACVIYKREKNKGVNDCG